MVKGYLAFAMSLLLTSPATYAGATAVPEPGTFELLALGGVIALVLAVRNRRKGRK